MDKWIFTRESGRFIRGGGSLLERKLERGSDS